MKCGHGELLLGKETDIKLGFYTYGREFDPVTDHKALEAIDSPRSKPCAPIKRWGAETPTI